MYYLVWLSPILQERYSCKNGYYSAYRPNTLYSNVIFTPVGMLFSVLQVFLYWLEMIKWNNNLIILLVTNIQYNRKLKIYSIDHFKIRNIRDKTHQSPPLIKLHDLHQPSDLFLALTQTIHPLSNTVRQH